MMDTTPEEQLNKIIAQRLKYVRDELDTQEELAESIGVSRDTLANWETARVRPPIAGLYAVAKHYHISIDYLVGLTNIKKPAHDIAAGMAAAEPKPSYRVAQEEGPSLSMPLELEVKLHRKANELGIPFQSLIIEILEGAMTRDTS